LVKQKPTSHQEWVFAFLEDPAGSRTACGILQEPASIFQVPETINFKMLNKFLRINTDFTFYSTNFPRKLIDVDYICGKRTWSNGKGNEETLTPGQCKEGVIPSSSCLTKIKGLCECSKRKYGWDARRIRMFQSRLIYLFATSEYPLLWFTLTDKNGTNAKAVTDFFKYCKRRGWLDRYIWVREIGDRGGLHHHHCIAEYVKEVEFTKFNRVWSHVRLNAGLASSPNGFRTYWDKSKYDRPQYIIDNPQSAVALAFYLVKYCSKAKGLQNFRVCGFSRGLKYQLPDYTLESVFDVKEKWDGDFSGVITYDLNIPELIQIIKTLNHE
jgi:hypothetical protein